MPRTLLKDEYWTKLLPILRDLGVYCKPNLRLIFEGILSKQDASGERTFVGSEHSRRSEGKRQKGAKEFHGANEAGQARGGSQSRPEFVAPALAGI